MNLKTSEQTFHQLLGSKEEELTSVLAKFVFFITLELTQCASIPAHYLQSEFLMQE